MFTNRADLIALDRRLRRIEDLLQLIAVRLEISPQEMDAERTRVSADVAALAARGKKIAAIKLLREQTGMDLASAKRTVDEL